MLLTAVTLSVAWQPAMRPHACRNAGSMLRSAAPHAGVLMQFGGSKLPAEIEALLEPSVDRKATVPMWKAFRKVYGSDAAAIAAAEKNVIPILSFINTEENIKENWQVLLEKFDREEAKDIITRNPGILANKSGDLKSSSPGEIRSSMAFVTAFDGVPPGIRTLIPPATAIFLITSIGTRIYQCQGVCG